MIKLVILFFLIILFAIIVLVIFFQDSKKTFNTTISGIILLEGEPSFNASLLKREIETRWKIKINNTNSNDGIVIFSNESYNLGNETYRS